MAESKVHHHRRDSDSETVASWRSLDHPPSFNRDKNQTVGSRYDATLVSPGPPVIYRLNTERTYIDKAKKVRRWTYGRRDRNKHNKVILLVGESGAGKTTLANTMINYLLGVRFEDKDFYQITEEEEQKDQSQSQTSDITVYEVFIEENPTSLTIIDIPGYTDTEGFERERQVSMDLRRLFSDEDGIHYIDAVCFVMKASQDRFSGKEDYIFKSVLSLFGRDIEDNIVFIITHSDGRAPIYALKAINTARIHCRRDGQKTPVHFLFNNQQKEKKEYTYKDSWEMGNNSFLEFLELLSENNRKSLHMTLDDRELLSENNRKSTRMTLDDRELLLENNRESPHMRLDDLTERKQLEARIFNVKDRITEKESYMEELDEILEAMRQNRDKIEKSENFLFKVNKTKKKKVPIENESWLNRNATCCDDCEENCHQFGCWYVAGADLSKCDVMTNNCCTVCTGKCPFTRHTKRGQKYVIEKCLQAVSFNDLKRKYKCTSDQSDTSVHKTKYEDTRKEHEENMKMSKSKTEKIEEKLNCDLKKIKEQVSNLLYKAYMTIMELSKNPLITDSYFTPKHMDFFISTMEREGEDEMAKNLKKVKKDTEELLNRNSSQGWMVNALAMGIAGFRELGVYMQRSGRRL